MFIIYNFLGFIITILSPVIIIYRILKGKEDPIRFSERYCSYKETKEKVTTIWFHTASVGEMMSIIPILKKLENNKRIKKFYLLLQLQALQKSFLNLSLIKLYINTFQ